MCNCIVYLLSDIFSLRKNMEEEYLEEGEIDTMNRRKNQTMARKKEKCHRQIVGGGRIKEKSESSKHHWDKNKPVYPE